MFKGSMPDVALQSLSDHWFIFLSILCLSSAWLFYLQDKYAVWLESTHHSSQTSLKEFSRKHLPKLFIFGCIAVGLWRAWQAMWIGDDAFISLRYSDMFARGEGLVFNRGEWVEGYTNFLWTLLLGLLGKLNVSLPHSAVLGNLILFAGSVVLSMRICQKVKLAFWPALVMSACYPCIAFATSGLETMPAAFCVLLGLSFLLSKQYILAGFGFVLAALMRPDHLLFWGCGGLSLLLSHLYLHKEAFLKRLRWSIYLKYSLPLFTIYLPYFIWRMNAYGELFPNTYYAKSGHLTYWKQGGLYLSSFLIGSGAWWMIVSLIILGMTGLYKVLNKKYFNQAVIQDNNAFLPKQSADLSFVLLSFCTLSILIFSAYVVKVGGDFMLYRFFVVLVPLYWFIFSALFGQKAWHKLILSLALAFALTPITLVKPMKKKWGLAAEESFYQVASFLPLELKSRYVISGKALNLLQQEVEKQIRVAVDCVGMIGFYGDVRIFDLFGLTSPRVAHKPLKRRGRPGHEKFGNLEDALAEDSTFSTVDLWSRAGFKKMSSYTRVMINGRRMYFLKFDPEIYQGLKALRTKKQKVTLPLSIHLATLKIQREARKGPNPKLLKFLERFYSLVLDQEPKLSQALKALKEAKKPSVHQQQFKTKVGDILKSLPSKSITAKQDLSAKSKPKNKSKPIKAKRPKTKRKRPKTKRKSTKTKRKSTKK